MSIEKVAIRLCGWLRQATNDDATYRDMYVLMRSIDNEADHWGVTDSDLMQADPDAVLDYLVLLEHLGMSRDNVLGGSMSDDVEEDGIVYAVGPEEGEYTSGPYPTRFHAEWVTGKVGEYLWRIEGQTGHAEVVDVWSDGRYVRGVHWPSGWARLQARGEAEDIWQKLESANPREVILNQLKEAEQSWIDQRKEREMATPIKKPLAKPPLPKAPVAPEVQEEIPFGETTTKLTKPTKSKTPAAAPTFEEGESIDALRSDAAQARDSVFVAVGQTLNVGNYESIRIDIGRCVTIKDGEDRDQIELQLVGEIVSRIRDLQAELAEALKVDMA